MKLILVAVLIVFVIYMALPSYFLEKAAGRETLEGITERLGQPLHSQLKLEGSLGSLVNTYRVGSQPPVCVDYIITFEHKVLSDGLTFKPIMRDWTWKWCGLPQL
jgi:hypothetical protein